MWLVFRDHGYRYQYANLVDEKPDDLTERETAYEMSPALAILEAAFSRIPRQRSELRGETLRLFERVKTGET